MATPNKPWEGKGPTMQRVNIGSTVGNPSRRYIPNSNVPLSFPNNSYLRNGVPSTGLPPLPPRPPQLAQSAYRPMLGGYSGYSGYGGYPSYGSYQGGMYGGMYGGYGSYGHGHGYNNRFIQAAEESSRGAFESVESIVNAFTSVSMMLESTYHAMYSSFRAVLGVVDNFSRLRQMFAQFISALTILSIVKNFYHRLLYWLGVINHNPQSDRIWESVAAASGNNAAGTYSTWPLVTFIGFLLGGPYLISKFFGFKKLEQQKWDPKKGTFYKTCHPHEALSEKELSFNENEVLNIAPPELQLQDNIGWLLAANRLGNVGYVPANRLSYPPRQESRPNQGSAPTNSINKDAQI